MIVVVYILLLSRILFSLNINKNRVISKVFRWKLFLFVVFLNMNGKVKIVMITVILIIKLTMILVVCVFVLKINLFEVLL